MNIKIAIIDSDLNYLERLSAVLQQYDELEVSVFTKMQAFQEAMENSNYSIALFNPVIFDTQIIFSPNIMPICLWTEECLNGKWYSEMYKVQKYQRISNIYKEIVKNYAHYASDNGMEYFKEGNANVIAVYSPVGGSGKTTMAFAVAKCLLKRNKKVLLLSVEQLNSSSLHCKIHEEGITQLVEAINDGTNFELTLKGIIKQTEDGILYVESFSRLVDYDDVSREEMINVIQKIKLCNICDYIIVDTGSTLDSINKSILENADKIVLVQRNGELADVKMSMFEQQIWIDDLKKHMYVIKNFTSSQIHYYELKNIPVIGTVHSYGNILHKDLLNYIEEENSIDVSFVM